MFLPIQTLVIYSCGLYKVVNAANTIITQAETRTDVDWSGGQGTQMENKNRVIAEGQSHTCMGL